MPYTDATGDLTGSCRPPLARSLNLGEPRDHVEQKIKLERLIVDIVRSLRDAEMHDTLHAFEQRVLSRDPAELFELSEEASEPHFKPMLELLLQEFACLAKKCALSPADRHARALEAMNLAGF
jgi:hypothetical protein